MSGIGNSAAHNTGDSGFRSDGTVPDSDKQEETGAKLRQRLLNACRRGRLQDVRELVGERLVDLPSCIVNDPHANTPLHVAALYGNKSILEYLVDEADCDAESRNADQNTPLYLAAGEGHLKVVKYLVEEKNVDPMCRCDSERTPLHNSCKRGKIHTVKYLINVPGVDASVEDSLEQTPLELAAEYGTKEVVEYMIENGAEASCDSEPYTLLHLAAFGGKLATVKYLAKSKRFDVTAKDKDSLTPLHSACHRGQLDVVKYLVEEFKMDLRPQRRLLSPLDMAAIKGRLNVVIYLVEEKNCKIECGKESRNRDTPLHHAAYAGHVDIMKYFADERRCNPACKGTKGRTPLHVACINDKIEMVHYLLDKEQVNASTKDLGGKTPLHIAARGGHLQLVQLLVRKSRVDHNVRDNNGKFPFDYASEHTKIVNYFKCVDGITSNKWSKRLHDDLKKFTLYCQPTGRGLGKGVMTTVVELELPNEVTRVAGKVLKPLESMEMNEERLRWFIREIKIVVGLLHDNVVSYKGVCFLPDILLPVLVMEQLMSSLHAYLKNNACSVPLDKKKSILVDVASGLEYLHSHTPAIIHHDLTPKNVLLNSENLKAKISDYCDARILATAEHMEDIGVEGPMIDIVFFGLLALFTFSEKEVVPAKSQGQVSYRLDSEYEKELAMEARQLLPSHSPLLELILQCLEPAKERPTAADLRGKLLHMKAYLSVGPYATLLKKYTKSATPTGNRLGVGAYGQVIEMKLGQEIVAGKIFKTSSVAQHNRVLDKVYEELITMIELDHQNIVKCMGLSLLPDQSLPVLLMEKLEGSLHDFIKSSETVVPLEKKMLILLDTACGLEYLHRRSPAIIHRDLTARNVLLDSQQRAKIADFGNSRIVDLYPDTSPRKLTSVPGTLDYMPPEAQGGKVTYGPSLDVFSFGHLCLVTIIHNPVMSLLPPTYYDSIRAICARSEVKRRQSHFQEAEKRLSKDHSLIELMKQCLHYLPGQRPRAGKLVARLNKMIHPDPQSGSPTKLDINDLFDVKREIQPVTRRWRNIGLALRLDPDQLNTIQTQYSRDLDDCLTEMLSLWLKRNYDTVKYGEPSWDKLALAVGDCAGGNDRALAEKLTKTQQDEIRQRQVPQKPPPKDVSHHQEMGRSDVVEKPHHQETRSSDEIRQRQVPQKPPPKGPSLWKFLCFLIFLTIVLLVLYAFW